MNINKAPNNNAITETVHGDNEHVRLNDNTIAMDVTEEVNEEEFKNNNNENINKKPKKGIMTHKINLQLLLFIQLFCLRYSAARQLASALRLLSKPYCFNNFISLEEEIGIVEINVCKEIIEENLMEEVKLSPVNEDSRQRMLYVTIDRA